MDWTEKAADAGKLIGAGAVAVLSVLRFWRHRRRKASLLGLEDVRPHPKGPDSKDLERRIIELEEFKDAAIERRVERVREFAEVRNMAANAEAAAERAEASAMAIRGEVTIELQGIQQRIDALLLRLARGTGATP